MNESELEMCINRLVNGHFYGVQFNAHSLIFDDVRCDNEQEAKFYKIKVKMEH